MSTSLLTCTGILLATLACWVRIVDQIVPQPYLDEVFHVPQAQQYCAGHWKSWDPKITTPPGLYLIASSLSTLVGCSTTLLRLENAVCLVLTFFSLYLLQSSSTKSVDSQSVDSQSVDSQSVDSQSVDSQSVDSQSVHSQSAAHTALNIVLFPPLFFFSALYYTDVPSTLSVVLFLSLQKTHLQAQSSQLLRGMCLYGLGTGSLFFRQTNIFWVAIFPAAVTLVQSLNKGHPVIRQSMLNGTSGFGNTWISIVKTSWKHGVVFDHVVRGASFEDYIKCIISIASGILRAVTHVSSLGQLLIDLAPFYGLLAAFIGFVVFNGSVVLGDKSNHIATLHLPQMLYLWPYILFFSWPLLLPRATAVVSHVFKSVSPRKRTSSTQHQLHNIATPRLRYILLFSAFAGVIIRYNTIIHPFTLADNRHYTFYVFRLLMRPWWMRYAVVPLYAFSAWLCVQALSNDTSTDRAVLQQQVSERPGAPARISEEPRTSLVIIWLVTTALQLITAPLVEPRYFILPWLIWRLNIPDQQTEQSTYEQTWIDELLQPRQTTRLWLETTWYLLINAVTGYIFLQWGFSWPSEAGVIQRFMW